MRFHVMCERDVGLFSLIDQVIGNLAWAIAERRVPVVHFMDQCCYWTPNGFHGADNVWEYYFEPVDPKWSAAQVPRFIKDELARERPGPFEIGREIAGYFVSAHYGDAPALYGKTTPIPYLLADPDERMRACLAPIVGRYVRPRAHITRKVAAFQRQHMQGHPVIGVHIRGTDAISPQEIRTHRRASLVLANYKAATSKLLVAEPMAKVFVATDDQASLDLMREWFSQRVISYDAIRHRCGALDGKGPTGWIMPAYIADDRDQAAQNGEEAVIEHLLLSACDHLVHNGSSLARTALVRAPALPHTNVHGQLWQRST